MGQGTQVRGQMGRQASVRSVEIMQEYTGGLSAHVTQQNTLDSQVTIFCSKEAVAVYLRVKQSTEGLSTEQS